ncbi:putative DNA-directed RNA polymerase subunit beta [Heracleum sosnowskyi]|uniref:DNA-directed RNA polymerase subunit beta n=1 Tax=Heracleum sosnowskyi TaxID=360622 RepID=A0AAD8HWJ7_9APIA|nr:putative DNA-directed RNA polymerase subunit beta [Heracleum sosnowskyi]
MGCTSSKLDDLPAVVLCRDRCNFLNDAIHHRYALADAHIAYFTSLKSIGISLHRFFHLRFTSSPAPPVLPLPTHRKLDPSPPASPIHHIHSHSNSIGSHLQFNSSDEDVSDSEHLHLHSESDSPIHNHNNHNNDMYGHLNYIDHETLAQYNNNDRENVAQYSNNDRGHFMNMNYMRRNRTPSVLYEQRPPVSETVKYGDFSSAASSSSAYNPYMYSNNNNQVASTSYGGNYNNSYGGFFGSTPAENVIPAVNVASTSKPPPSPPRGGSAWDFLNPFETFQDYYPPPHTPSMNSKELREEEGIPDLEDEDEVLKEVQGNQKFVDEGGGGGSHVGRDEYLKAAMEDVVEGKGKETSHDSEVHYRSSRPRESMDEDPVEYEVHMIDKKVVDKNEDKSGGHHPGLKTFRDDSEVVREIQIQFERASEMGNELSKMLEIGKHPHSRKHAAYQAVSSKMLSVVAPSHSIVSSEASTSESAPSLNYDGSVGLNSTNLSSTLQKLLLWEKKLYEEVKIEEKLRVQHERKSRKLKRLSEKGAEAQKIETTRILVRTLSTKTRIAIQAVDKISVKINELRDNELWPQLIGFIRGLTRLWKSMLVCHQSQLQAIGAARRLDDIVSNRYSSDAHLEATLQLEQELLNWVFRFSCWVASQKGYVRALNNWLLKCLLYEPEETADGIAPFSPGRMGAPPVFVICNQWSQALDAISEKEVVEKMRYFAAAVLQLWERDKVEMRQRMTVNGEMELKVKNLEREDQKIHKEIQELDKRIVLVSGEGNSLSVAGQVVYQSETSSNTSFQLSMQRIFEAMEKFTASSLKAYEELLQRSEELRLAGEQDTFSFVCKVVKCLCGVIQKPAEATTILFKFMRKTFPEPPTMCVLGLTLWRNPETESYPPFIKNGRDIG